MHLWKACLVSLVILSIWQLGCAESPTESPAPTGPVDTHLEVVSGGSQTGTWLEELPEATVIQLETDTGKPLADVSITFIRSDGNSPLPVEMIQTDSEGKIAYPWLMGREIDQSLVIDFAGDGIYQPTSLRLQTEARYGYRVPTARADGWAVGDIQEAGLDIARIAQGIERVRERELTNIHSLLIARHGKLVLEAYFPEDLIDNVYSRVNRDNGTHLMASVHKSFVSTLLGIAIDEGLVSGVQDQLYPYFPEYTSFANWSTPKESITLDNALTMRSGLGCSDAIDFWNQSDDWVKTTLDYPVINAPGTSFNYCTELTHVLGALIANAAGEPLEDFAASRLFQPLSMSPVEWRYSPAGRAISGFEFWMAPRDMIKLGQLVVDQGMWNGRQIVSPSWLRNATLQQVTVDSELGYGYQWWTRYFGSVGNSQYGVVAWGNGGQFILVFKDLDLVVGLTGGNYNSDQDRQGFTLVDENVIPAVQ